MALESGGIKSIPIHSAQSDIDSRLLLKEEAPLKRQEVRIHNLGCWLTGCLHPCHADVEMDLLHSGPSEFILLVYPHITRHYINTISSG